MGEHPIQAKAAWAVTVLLIVATAITLPFARNQWSEQTWLFAIFQSSTFLLYGMTALLLVLQVIATGQDRNFLWLAGGYFFTALSAIVQLITFPGIVSPTGGFGAGPQTSAWLWTIWHGGFPIFVLAKLMAGVVESQCDEFQQSGNVSFITLGPVWLSLISAVGVALICTRYSDSLPPITQTGSQNLPRGGWPGVFILLLNVVALATLVWLTRLRRPLFMWLAVGLLAFALDVQISLIAPVHYSVGWYVARCLNLVSAGSLMIALVVRTFIVYREAENRAVAFSDEARHDGLTGLFNRRYLIPRLTEELKRARRSQQPLSVLILDIDHFKHINDTYGHHGGDVCLISLTRELNARVQRAGDFVARYGGEEFVIVLPETDKIGAGNFAEDIRRRVSALYFESAVPYPITVSIGCVTVLSQLIATAEDVLAAGDMAMYQAKNEGRNRVVAADFEASIQKSEPFSPR